MAELGFWIIGLAVIGLLFDIHRRVSVTMDAVRRIEERLSADHSRHAR